MAGKEQSDSDDDKTEEPSAQRLEEFREEGQVAQSKELTSLLVLMATMACLYAMGPSLVGDFMGFTRRIFMEASVAELSKERAGALLMQSLKEMAILVLPIALAGFLAGALGSIVQFGLLFSWKPLEPQASRINPVAGFQRIFSLASLMEGFKSILKLIAVVAASYILLESELIGSATVIDMDSATFAAYMSSSAFRLVGGVCIGLLIVAAIDFSYQKFRYHKSLMMTKQEVKQEHKQNEGDPLLKARMRSIARETARKRMMQDVPKADVIVTNPTHIAVALRYDAEKMAAPRVVAKGADLVAQRIKEVARQNGIPLVENVPLARALHKSVKVGGAVPRSLYQAVAEVLAYVYRLKGRLG